MQSQVESTSHRLPGTGQPRPFKTEPQRREGVVKLSWIACRPLPFGLAGHGSARPSRHVELPENLARPEGLSVWALRCASRKGMIHCTHSPPWSLSGRISFTWLSTSDLKCGVA